LKHTIHFHPIIFELNILALSNILSMFSTLETSQEAMLSLNEDAPLNIASILVTPAVFQQRKLASNDDLSLNA